MPIVPVIYPEGIDIMELHESVERLLWHLPLSDSHFEKFKILLQIEV